MALPHRPRSRNGAGLPAVTPERIVDAAIRLTGRVGLENWTLRQLAAEIEASPAVVYHHVGDREAVVAQVIERVTSRIPTPPESLPWREWFATMLDNHRQVLRAYPGIAYRLARSGPAAATGQLGVSLLAEAGFGTESVIAHTVLMTTACQYIALADDDIFTYGIQRCLDGLEHRLADLAR
ncbi:TetR family transcriptional regulator [Actinocrispum wychmicini]|uniref:TetR family transcriptional regulator n=2 Tax=Actinocrispum wychmicini TaxID=1213861 RepID=A0A4R2JA96_9PSEU|nr:TetR family transcriptional regulator [Actinocrispum wychmicini]